MTKESIITAINNSNSTVTPIPLSQPTPPSLPPDILGSWLDEYIEAISLATETPRELSSMILLSVLGTCCQNRFVVEPELGYNEPVNIWTIVALEPGNRKSAVLKQLTDPLLEWEKIQADTLKSEIIRIESMRESQLVRIKSLRTEASKLQNELDFEDLTRHIASLEESLAQPPKLPRLWAQDITPEQTGVLMEENNERLAILSAEGGLFENLSGRYSGGIPNLDLFLQSHSGDPVRVDRGSRPSIYLQNPTLSIGLSPQPDVLKGLANQRGFRGRGLLARFLYAIPKSPLGYRKLNSSPVSSYLLATYRDNIHSLLNIDLLIDKHGQPQPYTLKLTPDAHATWKEFSRNVEVDLRDGRRFEYIKDWAGKLPGASARIAGVLHCAKFAKSQPWNHEICIDTMTRALTLASILSEHALAVFEMMGSDPSIEAAIKVENWINRNRCDHFTARECFESLKGTFKKMADLNPAFDVLVERRYIFEEDREGKVGRPSRVYFVNPVISKNWV